MQTTLRWRQSEASTLKWTGGNIFFLSAMTSQFSISPIIIDIQIMFCSRYLNCSSNSTSLSTILKNKQTTPSCRCNSQFLLLLLMNSTYVLSLCRVFIQDEKHRGITRTMATHVTTRYHNMEDVIRYVHMRSRNGADYYCITKQQWCVMVGGLTNLSPTLFSQTLSTDINLVAPFSLLC